MWLNNWVISPESFQFAYTFTFSSECALKTTLLSTVPWNPSLLKGGNVSTNSRKWLVKNFTFLGTFKWGFGVTVCEWVVCFSDSKGAVVWPLDLVRCITWTPKSANAAIADSLLYCFNVIIFLLLYLFILLWPEAVFLCYSPVTFGHSMVGGWKEPMEVI